MGAIRDDANTTFRDYVTDGLPSSGQHKPQKSDIRSLFGTVEEAVASVTLAAGVQVTFPTAADMEADESQEDGTLALVWNDPTPENNGYWVWDESGSPSAWVKSALADPSGAIQEGLDQIEAAKTDALDDINTASADGVSAVQAAQEACLLYTSPSPRD